MKVPNTKIPKRGLFIEQTFSVKKCLKNVIIHSLEEQIRSTTQQKTKLQKL
jgi:hypothetical protein